MIRIIRLVPPRDYSGPRGAQITRSVMSSRSWKVGLVSISLLAATSYAIAQMSGPTGTQGRPSDHPMMSSQDEMHSQMHAHMMQMMQGQQGMMAMHGGLTQQPALPGQDGIRCYPRDYASSAVRSHDRLV
jgi:hypothetical protein